MADFLHAITPAGGVPPQIGDADDGFVTRFNVDWPEDEYREVLSAVEAVFGNGSACAAIAAEGILVMHSVQERWLEVG